MAFLLSLAIASAAAPRYSVVLLGGSEEGLFPLAINRHGQIVGYGSDIETGDIKTAFIYSRGSLLFFTNRNDSVNAIFTHINDHGIITGISYGQSGEYPFFYRFNDGQASFDLTQAEIIPVRDVAFHQSNSRGTAIGTLWSQNPLVTAVTYERGVFSVLPVLEAGQESAAADINDRGQIIGYVYNPNRGDGRAVLWQNGKVAELGLLPGFDHTAGLRINDRGVAVGSAFQSRDTGPGPFLVTWIYRQGRMTQLPTPAGVNYFVTRGINNRDQIIAESNGLDPAMWAQHWLYSDGVLYDLATLLPPDVKCVIGTLQDINDRGEIIGWGYITREDGDHFCSFVLVPE